MQKTFRVKGSNIVFLIKIRYSEKNEAEVNMLEKSYIIIRANPMSICVCV